MNGEKARHGGRIPRELGGWGSLPSNDCETDWEAEEGRESSRRQRERCRLSLERSRRLDSEVEKEESEESRGRQREKAACSEAETEEEERWDRAARENTAEKRDTTNYSPVKTRDILVGDIQSSH